MVHTLTRLFFIVALWYTFQLNAFPVVLRSRQRPQLMELQVHPRHQGRWYTFGSTPDLASAIPKILHPDDIVVEMGAQLRAVSSQIVQVVDSSVLFLDIQRKFPTDLNTTRTQAMRLVTTSTAPSALRNDKSDVKDVFVEMERLDSWRSLLLSHPTFQRRCTVLVLDLTAIVGNDLHWSALALIQEFTSLVPTCQTVLVKSKLLHQWAYRILHAEHWLSRGPRRTRRAPVRSPKIVAAVGVRQYRRTIPVTVQTGDRVMEVGCHFGSTTALLQEQVQGSATTFATRALGVDVDPSIIRAAEQRNPGPHYAICDAWKTLQLQRLLQTTMGWETSAECTSLLDVIYLDIGGLSGADGLMEALVLLQSLQSAFEPRTIVIKSACVHRLSGLLVPFRVAPPSAKNRSFQ